MSALEDLKDDNTKAELQEMAKEADLPTDGNKDDIARRILGLPPEEEEEAETAEDDADDNTPDGQVGYATPEAAESAAENADEELDLLKYTGTSLAFQVGTYQFSRNAPYLAVPARTAEHALRQWPNLFRPASRQEIADYYA